MPKSKYSEQIVKPDPAYNFANIPSLVMNLLVKNTPTAMPQDVLISRKKEFDNVILVLVDGFGWDLLTRHKKSKGLKSFLQKAKATKITAQFPPTTAAQITTVNSNEKVGDHGVYEWFYFEPLVDEVIAPLPFSFARDRSRESLKDARIDPSAFFPKNTIYQQLRKKKVNSFAFQHIDYSASSYTSALFKGSNIVPFQTTTEGVYNLAELVNSSKGKNYFYFYYSGIDSVAHKYGPESPLVSAEIDTFFDLFNKFLIEKIKSPKTLLILSADHGEANMNPEKTFYVDIKIPSFVNYIKKNKKGELIAPAGSPRDMFLHIKEDKIDEAYDVLGKAVSRIADVYRTQDLIDDGFFGEKISSEFKNRVGNLVVLAHENESVYWSGDGKFKQVFKGHHGALTAKEMEIPLVVREF